MRYIHAACAFLVCFLAVHPRRQPGGVRAPDRHAQACAGQRGGERGGCVEESQGGRVRIRGYHFLVRIQGDTYASVMFHFCMYTCNHRRVPMRTSAEFLGRWVQNDFIARAQLAQGFLSTIVLTCVLPPCVLGAVYNFRYLRAHRPGSQRSFFCSPPVVLA